MNDIPLLTGPQDPAEMQAMINALIRMINAMNAGPGSGMATDGSNATEGAINNIADAGAANGVDLTIAAGTVTTVGTVGYSYGPDLNLTGGANVGGYYGYGGNISIYGGPSSGASNNYQGNVYVGANRVEVFADLRTSFQSPQHTLNTNSGSLVRINSNGVLLQPAGGGNLTINNLPTTSVGGIVVWNDGGTLKIG